MTKALSLGENPGIEVLERWTSELGEDIMIWAYAARTLLDFNGS